MGRKPDERSVGFMVRRIHDAVDERLNREICDRRLSSRQMAVIAYLRGREDRPTTISDLQAFLGVSHPTVSGIIRELETRGLVRVEVDAQDRRARLLTLGDTVNEAFTGRRQDPAELDAALLRCCGASRWRSARSWSRCSGGCMRTSPGDPARKRNRAVRSPTVRQRFTP